MPPITEQANLAPSANQDEARDLNSQRASSLLGAPSTETRVFIGVFREPFQELYAKIRGFYVSCNCGTVLKTVTQIRDHWARGCFDQPIYATRDEIIAKAAATITSNQAPNIAGPDQSSNPATG